MGRNRLLLTTAFMALAGGGAPAMAQDLGFTLDPILLGSAFRDERAILDTPVAASVVEGEALADRQAGDFGELIGDIPGLSIDGGPRGISQEPNIRGFRDEQIVLRFDGGRLNFNQAHRGRFFVDPDLVQRVEVVRGGGSTLFGSGALGGVISVETVDAADLLAPGQELGGRVTLGWSSNGSQLNGTSAVYGDHGAVDYLFALSGRSVTDDVAAGDGTEVPFSQIDQGNALVKLGIEPDDANRIELSYSLYRDEGLVPSNSSDNPDGSNPVVDRDGVVRDLRLSWDHAPSDSDWLDLSVLFYATRLEIDEFRVPPGAPRLDETRYDTFGLEIVNRSTLDLGVPVDLVYGVEGFRDTQEGLRDGGPRAAFPDAAATTFGAFAEGTIGLTESFDLILGARFDSYERDPDDPTLEAVEDTFLSPRIGFSFRPNQDWQIFGNVARAYRAPNLSELYNDGVHFTTGPGFPAPPGSGTPPGTFFSGRNVFVPNPDLDPESSTQYELGARYEATDVLSQGDRISLSFNGYYADVADFIDSFVLFVDPATLRPNPAPGPFPFLADGTTNTRNVDAELWGFEAELDYDAELWFAGAGIGIARGEGEDGTPLGSIPQDRLTLLGGYRPTADWEIGARATLTADKDDTPSGIAAPGYGLLDLFATYAPETGPLSGSTIRFGIDNLLDEDYTIYPNGLPQPGRSFEISATFTF